MLARTLRRHLVRGLVVPDVAARLHVDGAARAFDDDDVVDAADFRDRGVSVGLQRHFAAGTQPFVGSDDDVGAAVLDAAGE